MYSMVYIMWNLVSEAWFDKKTWPGYLKKKCYIHGMLQQIRSIFFKLSLQNTHGQLMASWLLPNLLA